MMTRRHRDHDDSGATAILVGIVTTVLIGLMVFTADFGLAYANKRATQTAADAAALGAAVIFAEQDVRSCAAILEAGRSEAQEEAREKVVQNRTHSSQGELVGGAIETVCDEDGLRVTATVQAPSPNFVGGIFGRRDDYQVTARATAVVAAAGAAPRLRPMALCAADIPANTTAGTAFNLYAPGDGDGKTGTEWGTASCPLPDNTGAGNWWTLDCPNENSTDGQGNQALADQIRNGCSTPVSVVPGQGDLTGEPLNRVLADFCPTESTSDPYACLSGDPGQPDAGNVPAAWQSLIQSGAVVPIPVFCTAPRPDGSTDGKCAYNSITSTGTNAVFPVHKLMAVQVCGYHFGKQNKNQYPRPGDPTPPNCGEADALLKNLRHDKSDDMYLTLIARQMIVGNVSDPGDCALGGSCDGGLRRVNLTE